jgi:hypothetical protein
MARGLDQWAEHPSRQTWGRTIARRHDVAAMSGDMSAFVWNTNHRMWKVVPPFADSFGVLKAYICDPSAYVYWSTPRFHDAIKVGDLAYILRTADESGNDGIVACGRVEETPRQLTATSVSQFTFPDRLTPAGWDEQVAPSSWKTGIRIEKTFWDDPIKGVPPAIGTVGQLSDERLRAVEGEIAAR